MRKKLKAALASLVLIMCGMMPNAQAQTYQIYSGHINQVYMSGPSNYAFRIFLDAGFGDCTGGFAYINADYPVFQAYVSGLLTAYAQRKRVRVTVTKVDYAGVPYCQIAEFGFDDN